MLLQNCTTHKAVKGILTQLSGHWTGTQKKKKKKRCMTVQYLKIFTHRRWNQQAALVALALPVNETLLTQQHTRVQFHLGTCVEKTCL